MFQERWLAETGQSVAFEESYVGSGAQSRAIVEGFEADVAALSLQADVDRIEAAGLIGHPWRDNGTNGMVSRSVVAFAVRPGNPKAIAEWSDLAAPSTEVLMPNPKTSGGAQWNVLAIYGAAMRGQVDGVPGDDADAALGFLASVLGNVTVMDKAARESITSFEKGIGDVAITYENEVLVGRQSGQNYELVIPSSTILIENPVAVIDEYADAHDVREVADAFAAFLTTPEAQRAFARHGLRSVDDNVAAEFAADYRPVDDLFTIEEFGGWTQATADFFGEDGLYAQAIATATAGGQ
jgi:sulfate transport system substrate-binding protein